MPSTRKNILFLPKWYPNKDDAYQGIFVHRHAICVSKFHNVYVLYAKATEQKQMISANESVEDGVKILRYYYKKRILGIGFIDAIIKLLLYFICCLKGWNQFCEQKLRIDAFHIHVLGRTSVFGLYLKKKTDLPIFITEHWSGYFKERNQYNKPLRKFFDRLICAKSSKITTVSDGQAFEMKRHNLKGDYTTVRNVVVNNFFMQTPKIVHKSQFLVVADQVNYVKNIDGIIRAFNNIEDKSMRLSIIGDGPDLDYNKKLTSELDLDGRVKFHGGKNADFVADEMNKSIALILFSNFENSPCVIGESFAVGIPVISTNVGGILELVTSKRGIQIKPKDEKSLTDAINIICNQNFDTKELSDYAREEFSMDKISEQFNKLYTSF